MEDKQLTLNSAYVLKQASKNRFTLFNTFASKEYTISKGFYLFLKIFKYNLTSLSNVLEYFNSKGIDINRTGALEQITNENFSDLLVEANKPYINSVQKEIPVFNFPSFIDNTPNRVDLLLTEKCNLKCLHCFQESTPLIKKDFPPLDRLLTLFDEIELLDIDTLKISGGELLVYPHIKEVLSYLSQKRFKKTLLTNGILIDDEIIDILKGRNYSLGVSLDGSNALTHEFLRGKNTFDRTIRNITKLKENNIKFSLTTTLHKYNFDDLQNVARLAYKLGAKRLNINKVEPLGRGAENDLSLKYKEIEFIKKISCLLQEELGSDFLDFVDAKDLLQEDICGDRIYCSAGTSILAISPQLEVYPCTYAFHNNEYKMGNLYESSLLDIWTNDKWMLFRGGVKLNELNKCGSCQFNKKCMQRNCRLKPVAQGNSFYDAITYCKNSSA